MSLAVLVTIVLIGGIVYLGQNPPPPPIVRLPKPKPATIESQISYRWDAALGRTLKLGLKESVLPTVKLTVGKIKKQQKAIEQSVKMA